MSNIEEARKTAIRGDMFNIDALDMRLADKEEGGEWLCKWSEGRNPRGRIVVDGDWTLHMFLNEVEKKVRENDKISILETIARLPGGLSEQIAIKGRSSW